MVCWIWHRAVAGSLIEGFRVYDCHLSSVIVFVRQLAYYVGILLFVLFVRSDADVHVL